MMQLIASLKMLLQIFLIFSIYLSNALAEKNFWNNEICISDSDCSGLTSCDATFGCTLSVWKVGLVMLSVFLSLCALCVAATCLCRRNLGNTRFVRRNNQYLPSSVIHINPPQYNQHQMGATTVYPHQPYPNQIYLNAGNTPLYNQYQMGPGMGDTIHASHEPTAPLAGMNYGHLQQNHYTQH